MQKYFMRFPVLIMLIAAAIVSCKQKESADLLIINGTIYTVDSSFSVAEAMLVKDGKILATGTRQSLMDRYNAKETFDAGGNFIYPGFIDAHCHFMAYGKGQNECNLVGTKSWNEVIDRLKAFAHGHPEGWLIGRGWDQNDWADKQFPTNEALNSLFPDRAVLLTRVDGHAAIANQAALDLSGLKAEQKIAGGEIVAQNGKLTGLLIDNAKSLVQEHLPAASNQNKTQWLQTAQQKCFAAGLTSVQDCGLDFDDVFLIKKLYDSNALQIRMYVMLSDKKENYEWAFKEGKIKTPSLTVCAFKLYADGALGSRGACLLHPYADKPGHYGFILNDHSYFDSILNVIADHDWQACTHAIGDSANRIILQLYKEKLLRKGDLRWRIEHAQVVNENDFRLFAESHTIPSVQPTHATSDMYWAELRLGKERIQNAYAYQHLLQQNNWLPLGTDFPVEDISPIKTFFAAVFRKDDKGFPDTGFQVQNALSRQQAIKGMTIWAAKAAFEEKEKGSLEKGKLADFVILEKDLMHESQSSLIATKVLYTFLGGRLVFKMKP